ncbi:MAG TPA: thermonuclease family protein [Candidatus Omnitrophota bacterium]|nr:thermonuclease family protein [Candidatus Omnitrophota bacterium]HPN66576.1 thermonuclease family protein [Candidatus Omnitrophota bacterium]
MDHGVFADELFVTRVIDGDTIVMENGEHVRYIGIDTPERGRPYYKEAKRQNEGLVKGRRVRLEYDVGRTDRYGRTLAYVYAGEIFVNEELVRRGYALAYTVPPNVKYSKRFVSLQQEARDQKRGIWSEEKPEPKKKKTVWDYFLYKLRYLLG